MARRAMDYALHSKTARLRLKPRPKAYFRQVGPNLTLGYIRRDSGPGSWQIRERIGGKPRTLIIGAADDIGRADGRDVLTFTQAQERATRPAHVAEGKMTVRQALELHLTDLATRSAHSKEARQRADKHIAPALGDHLVARITTTQIKKWLGGMVRDGDAESRRRSMDSANRVLTILRAALNAAFEDEANGIPTDTAWRRVKPFEDVGASRPDHFSAAEIRSLVAKAASFDPAFAALLEFAFLSGARYGELASATVGDFSAQRRALQVRGKTHARTITLSAEAAGFLATGTRGRLPTAPLLPKADGSAWGKSEQHRPMKRALLLAKLPSTASVYTLRHSYISRAIEIGMPLTLIAENCGTSLRMIERTYAHILADKRRELVERHAPSLRRVK